MQTSAAGVSLIKGFESFFAKPYLCPAGVPTIGYGTTYYMDGQKVKLTDASITESAASALLANQLTGEYEPGVQHLVTIELRQCEFDALVSFAYNCGIRALATSTLLRLLNAGDKFGASQQFALWNKGGGKVLAGLVRRREVERVMFLGGAHAATA